MPVWAAACLLAAGLIWAGWRWTYRWELALVALVIAATCASLLLLGLGMGSPIEGFLSRIRAHLLISVPSWLQVLAVLVVVLGAIAFALFNTWRQRRSIVLILLMSALPSALIYPSTGALVSRLHDIKTPDL